MRYKTKHYCLQFYRKECQHLLRNKFKMANLNLKLFALFFYKNLLDNFLERPFYFIQMFCFNLDLF